MGYRTDFSGSFKLDKPLGKPHKAYIEKFCETRRMRRDASKTANRKDPLRIAAKLGVGKDGGYFVGEGGWAGQDNGRDVLDQNNPPSGQPGLWCQWIPSPDGSEIVWDGGEKFYEYEGWLAYIIEHFLEPWGYKLNGEVKWQGEDPDDMGKLIVRDNHVSTQNGRVVYD